MTYIRKRYFSFSSQFQSRFLFQVLATLWAFHFNRVYKPKIDALWLPPKPDKVENPDPDFSSGEDLERWREQIVFNASASAFQKTILKVFL